MSLPSPRFDRPARAFTPPPPHLAPTAAGPDAPGTPHSPAAASGAPADAAGLPAARPYDDSIFEPQNAAPAGPRIGRKPTASNIALNEAIRQVLRDHPERPAGFTVDEIRAVLAARGNDLPAAEVRTRCIVLVRAGQMVSTQKSGKLGGRFRLVEAGEISSLHCKQKNWDLLVALITTRLTDIDEFCAATGHAKSTVKGFARSMQHCGAARNDSGLPVVDLDHPDVRRELLRLHAVVNPPAERPPTPRRPKTHDHSTGVLFDFLATRPQDEWLTIRQMSRHLDCSEHPSWPSNRLHKYVADGWVQRKQTRGPELPTMPYRYRISPAYRRRCAAIAAGFDWAAFLARGRAAPALPPPSPTPAAPLVLDGNFLDRLNDRPAAAGAPAGPVEVRQFYATGEFARQIGHRRDPAPSTIDQVIQLLQAQPDPHAVVCMPTGYVETWRDATGTWCYAAADGPPDGAQPRPLASLPGVHPTGPLGVVVITLGPRGAAAAT